MVIDGKLIKLFGVNFVMVLVIVVTASALSDYTENARENSISNRIKNVEDAIYELETTSLSDENITLKVYNIMPLISNVNYDLKNYLRQELINKGFYEKSDEKMVSLMVLYLKTLKQVFSDRVLVQFFCTYDSQSCDYESFVLSYIAKKYSDKIFAFHFDGESTHPLIKLIRDKYGVDELPFMLINDEPVKGFINSNDLEIKILEHVNNSS